MRIRNCYTFLTAAIVLQSCNLELPETVAVAYAELPKKKLDYNIHVKPILSDKCFACHGPDPGKRKAELRLDIADSAFAPLAESPGKVAIDPGNPGGSELFHRIISSDPEYRMPAPESHLTLTDHERAILIKWIEEGAEYQPHWAFVKPQHQEVPEVDDQQWVANAIDNFVLQKLEERKLTPSGPAEKEILLRRVSLDLTGLPPTPAEIENFRQDNSPNAFEKQVDRLLASPHYGEKMAVDWLDVARFADSHGYSLDRYRDMSPYRDWVIKSFNDNLPYDKFVQWQLAGDLMPNPTNEMIVATGFNRNHQQNMEGGVVEEEFQAEYVIDRTNTFGDAFLGLSVGCARCHDHKFDPITQKNYYELFSFFNNVREAGQISFNDAMPTPTLMLPTAAQESAIAQLKKLIAEQEKSVAVIREESKPYFQQWLGTSAYISLRDDNPPKENLLAHYTFDQGIIRNDVDRRQHGVMQQQSGPEQARFMKRNSGNALLLNGDAWLDLTSTGVFRKSDRFTIGLWATIPKDLEEGVIFHKSLAERLFNFRGYHLYLKQGKLELSMAHTAPSDAIFKISTEIIPRDQWIHLAVTYDGSSKADGLRLYIDGKEVLMETITDQLRKDILFGAEFSYGPAKKQPGLQVGAWDRGFGIAGGQVDDICVYDRNLTPFEINILAGKATWTAVTTPSAADLSAEGRSALEDYYLSALHPPMQHALKHLQVLRNELADSVEKVKEVMVMQEMPQRKKAFILKRGNYDTPGDEVFPDAPASVLPFPQTLPRNRHGLAQWVTHSDNPLTARVAVNRFWQMFFGTGLVKTSQDFGNQGELPSHPELLDWLAVTFRESGWNIKAINKLIVMSATYRQDSRASEGSREKDPDNRLLARGPAFRMSAEMVRDNALAASGLLNKSIGGKSIKPYQPSGLWEINNLTYAQDTGSAVYRRSLYILAKRAVPNPTLATFDATSRSFCVARRETTNTPLQALVTLNDPTFIETSTALGAQMAKINDTSKAIRDTFIKLTGRSASDKELDLLLELHTSQLKDFQRHPAKTKGWLQAGQFRTAHAPAQVAAHAVVASVILNSDATLTRR